MPSWNSVSIKLIKWRGWLDLIVNLFSKIHIEIMNFITTLLVICLCCTIGNTAYAQNKKFVPYEVWNDTDGNPINAHGGGILFHNGVYYWYGEYKIGKTILPEWATWECYRTDVTGISCYSSRDLLNWKFEGIVLQAEKNDSTSDLHPSKVVERPKVIYNARTGKFVMWMHIDSAD